MSARPRARVAGWAWAWLIASLVAAFARPVAAHEFRPGVLVLDELAPGTFSVAWQPGLALEAPGAPTFTPRFPDPCVAHGATLSCGAAGLTGELTVDGIETGFLDVAVRVRTLDGAQQFAVLDARHPVLTLGARAPFPSAAGYFRLGLEHIAFGFDHLLFVLALTLLVGWSRRLAWTVTAFTLGHALSLAASVLGLVHVPQAPVEAVIALSVLLLAVELTRARDTFTRRWPAVVAGGFGLVHGLGFADALREIGLPEHGLAGALAAFNLGIEVGQLAVVALVIALTRMLRTSAALRVRVGPVPAYAIGGLAAAWLVERVLGFWGAA